MLDYCLRIGSKDVADHFQYVLHTSLPNLGISTLALIPILDAKTIRCTHRQKVHIKHIETLRTFQYIDENGEDKGALVRRLATDIYTLLKDNDHLRRVRKGQTLFPDSDSDGEGEESLSDIPEDGEILLVSACFPLPPSLFLKSMDTSC